jgi:hypothetical protein
MGKNMITKEQFLSATLNQISQVYSGKRKCCRCGCGGDYTATSFMVEARSDVNDSLVEKRLRRAKRLVESGAEVMYGETYVDVETGNDRSLTFYFDEISKN